MNDYETQNATFVTLPFELAIAMSEDEDGTIWYHVVSKQANGKWYSIYRAASFEDATDVLSAF